MDSAALLELFLLAGLIYFALMIFAMLVFLWFLYAIWQKIQQWE